MKNLIKNISKMFPALILTGPRQVGKTSLLKKMFNDYNYITLDIPSTAEMAEKNPDIFLKELKKPVILDEIQYAPSLFRHLKIEVDNDTSKGQYFLTGSQNFLLMHGVTESLSGRCAVLNMLGLTVHEIQNNFNNRLNQIRNCWQEGGKDKARELIRDIRSISVVLLPKYFQTDSLYKYETLSLNPYSIISKINKLTEEIEGEFPQFILKLEESSFDDFDEEKKLFSVDYENLTSENIIALNSDLVGYSKEHGLDFENNIAIS